MNSFPFNLGSAAGLAAGAAIAVVIAGILVALLCAAFYVFYSIIIYQFAKKHGLPHAWMAWIPYLNNYLVGEAAGPMRVLGRFEIRYTGLWLALAQVVVAGVARLVEGFSAIPLIGAVFGVLSGIIGVVGSIAALLFFCLVLYRIYSRYLPKNTTLAFAILSIFVVTVPFFLASILNKPQISEGYDFEV